jgi:hypothetical protein
VAQLDGGRIITREELRDITERHTSQLWLCGILRYQDVFDPKNEHVTKICRRYYVWGVEPMFVLDGPASAGARLPVMRKKKTPTRKKSARPKTKATKAHTKKRSVKRKPARSKKSKGPAAQIHQGVSTAPAVVPEAGSDDLPETEEYGGES